MKVPTLLNKVSSQYGQGMSEAEISDLVSKTNQSYDNLIAGYNAKIALVLANSAYNEEHAVEIKEKKIDAKPIPKFTTKDKIVKTMESWWFRHACAWCYVPITSFMQWVLSGGLFNSSKGNDMETDPDWLMFKFMQDFTKNKSRK